MLQNWYFCTTDQVNANPVCLSVFLTAKTSRKTTDSDTHTHTHLSLFIVLQAVKTHLGKASAVRFASTACLHKYNCHRSVSHTFSHTLFIGHKSWSHKCSFNLSRTHTNTIKRVLMCEKIPDSVTAWPFTFIWPHKMKPPVKQTAEQREDVCVSECVRAVASVFIANIYRRQCWTLLFSRLQNFCGHRHCVHC